MEVNSQAVRFALKFRVTQTIQEEPVAHHMVVATEVEEVATVEVIEAEDHTVVEREGAAKVEIAEAAIEAQDHHHTVVEREDAAKAAEAIAEEDHINLTKESVSKPTFFFAPA